MNRQEAIRILKKELEITKDIDKRFGDFPEHREALEMAISSLEAEPCEDCISRQLVLDKIQRLIDAEGNCHDENGNYLSYAQERVNSYEAIQQFVECEFLCPSVYPKREPVHARWIVKEGREQGYDIGGVKTWYMQIKCSECGFIKTAIEGHTGQYNYCPNCGADMRADRSVENGNDD